MTAYINKEHKYKKNDGDIKKKIRREVYGSSTWLHLKESFLRSHPVCYICQQNEQITPADCVHHIISFVDKKDYTRFAFDEQNLVALCNFHHSQIHGQHAEESLYYLYHLGDNTTDTEYF